MRRIVSDGVNDVNTSTGRVRLGVASFVLGAPTADVEAVETAGVEPVVGDVRDFVVAGEALAGFPFRFGDRRRGLCPAGGDAELGCEFERGPSS